MSVLSYEQTLLTTYLATTDMTLARRMYIVGILWEEEATKEMLLPLTTENKSYAIIEFTKIAMNDLPEKDFHYEISQVFKDLMGYT